MDISVPSNEIHFMTHNFLHLIPWVPLVPFNMGIHKPLQQLLTNITPNIMLTWSFSSTLKLPANPEICIEGISPRMPMNILEWRLPPAGCNADFIVMVLFYAPAAELPINRSLWFTWWLVSIGITGGNCTPYYIKNYLTLGLKFPKKVTAMSNRNDTSCGS